MIHSFMHIIINLNCQRTVVYCRFHDCQLSIDCQRTVAYCRFHDCQLSIVHCQLLKTPFL